VSSSAYAARGSGTSTWKGSEPRWCDGGFSGEKLTPRILLGTGVTIAGIWLVLL
jgi:hypothetical protein